MTGAESCFLMLFDDQGKYVSSRLHIGDSKAPFSSFISESYVLILPSQHRGLNLSGQRAVLYLPESVLSPSGNELEKPII